MKARFVRLAGFLAVCCATGCVDRKFVVESNVPNAQVYIDNKSVGAAPAYSTFDYYGYYTFMVVHPGYETVIQRRKIATPWYSYPGLDFISDVLLPFHIRDTRRIYIELHEATPTRTDDVLNRADALRQRGMLLPTPDRPAEPRPGTNPAPRPPVIQPPVDPAPGPGVVPGPGPAAPGVVPSVTPGYSPVPTSYIK